MFLKFKSVYLDIKMIGLLISMVISKEEFLKVYSNLPEGVRRETIIVIEDKPYTWNAVYVEIVNDSEFGKLMLDKIDKLGIFGGKTNG